MENNRPTSSNDITTSGALPEPPNKTVDDPKLVPEWGILADDQIVLIGFVVIIAVLAGFGLEALGALEFLGLAAD